MRPTQLYLDTARLGRMSPLAQRAQVDFTRLAGREGASPFFERFLHDGSTSWPQALRSRFPGLNCWQGCGQLKQNLRTIAGSCPTLPVLTVNRLAQLMKFAARLLFHPCRNVMVTDLGWRPYHDILENEARRAGRKVSAVAIRELACKESATEDELIGELRDGFVRAQCDGLFLTSVSHLGLRLPIERLVRELEAVREVRFVVIDGAQEFGQLTTDLHHEYCDLYLTGCHKWLGGFHPMGLGFYGRQRSRGVIETVLAHLLESGELDDPLLRFTTQLERGLLDGETETINLIPLFTSQGAAADALSPSLLPSAMTTRNKNLTQVASLAQSSGWSPVLPAPAFRTGILLLRAEAEPTRAQSSQELRDGFSKDGIALTAYEGGLVRLSMPAEAWQVQETDRLRRVLQAVT